MKKHNVRFHVIDMYRSIAILLVVIYHYFYRWAPPNHKTLLYPYDNWADYSFIKFGYLGVELFFIVSGFVIAMTLQNCKNPIDFAIRRISRLLPAMVVCSLITIIAIDFMGIEPFSGMTSFWNIIPSWTFTSPYFWKDIFPVTNYIDGSYWSLYVEIKFYFYASVIYFLSPKNFLRNFMLFSIMMVLVFLAQKMLGIDQLGKLLKFLLLPKYIMLFTSGIIFYEMFKSAKIKAYLHWLMAGSFVLQILMLFVEYKHDINDSIIASILIAVFYGMFYAFCLGWNPKENWLLKLFSIIGLSSYPLYLLHQNIGVSIIYHSEILGNFYLQLIAICVMLAIMVFVSIYINKYVEKPGKDIILKISSYFSRS